MEKRPLAIDDLARIVTPSDPQISPDGVRVAFVLKTMDVAKNKYFAHIHIVDAAAAASPDGKEAAPRQLTRSQNSEGSPRWSPDGRFLAFTSGREDKKGQIFVLPVGDGGEAERVSDLPPGDLGEIAWSPNVTRIAFTFRAKDEEFRDEAVEERKKDERSTPVREITRLHYREEGTGFTPRERFGVHVLDLASRQVTRVTPVGDQERDYGPFCWSPDGTRIAYVTNTAPDPDLLPNAEDIFVISAAGEGAPVKLNCPQGPKNALAWSPDGAYVTYLGHDKADEVWGVTNVHPWVVPVDGDESARDLTPSWDVHCGSAAIGDVLGGGESGPHWEKDGKSLLVLASDRGAVDVYRVSLDASAPPRRLTEGTHTVAGFTLAANGDAALLVGTPADAGDVYGLPAGSSFFRRLTRLNQAFFDESDFATPKAFDAPALPGGHAVPCWAAFPPDFIENPGPRPTILYIHGGPHLMYAHTLFFEYQALAAQGYVVLYPNPRGSKGYGEEWTGAIKGNWGDPAHEDVMACVDYAVAQGWSDPARLGVAGGSYGGYLTGWIVGHDDRFACAVAERGVFNLVSMAGTCDFVWTDRGYFEANTWDDPAEYLRNSPLTYAAKITTPLLIVHSEGDLRCPIEQAEQLFAALKRQGKNVVFLRYGPESNHNLSRGGPPDLRLDRQKRLLAWFDKHLKREPATTANVSETNKEK